MQWLHKQPLGPSNVVVQHLSLSNLKVSYQFSLESELKRPPSSLVLINILTANDIRSTREKNRSQEVRMHPNHHSPEQRSLFAQYVPGI